MKHMIFCIAISFIACRSFAQDTTKTYIINFKGNKTELTKESKLILDSVVSTLKAWPVNCTIISGNYGENEKRLMLGYTRIRAITV
jgi:outer membrane protein OmpA-like peptidoglycan-associated protein